MKPIFLVLFLALMIVPIVLAYDFNDKPSADEKSLFDNFLEPLMRIYRFIKYVATAIGVLVITIAGIVAITSGNDPERRNKAKEMIGYVLIGILIIWLAPLIVQIVVGG